MKTLCISVDCSRWEDKIRDIKNILNWDVMDLLKPVFQVNGLIQDGVFLKIYIDVERVDGITMDYSSIVNFCNTLVRRMIYYHDYDPLVSVYTDRLPKELQPDDASILEGLRKKLSDDQDEISISVDLANEICRYCENDLAKPEFYYVICKKLEMKMLRDQMFKC